MSLKRSVVLWWTFVSPPTVEGPGFEGVVGLGLGDERIIVVESRTVNELVGVSQLAYGSAPKTRVCTEGLFYCTT